MKKNYVLSAAAVALVAGSAIAAQQELQTFLPSATPVYAFDSVNDALNPVINPVFTGLVSGVPYTPVAWEIRFDLTSVAPGTWVQDLDIDVTAPGELAPTTYNVGGQTYTTTLNRGGVIALPVGNSGIGTWTVKFSENFEDGPVDGIESEISNVRFALITSDAPTTFGTLPTPNGATNAWSTATGTVASGATTWFQLVVPSAINGTGLGNALDIDMVGSNLAPNNDASFALWNAADGTLVSVDNDFGPGALPQMSFGKGARAATGDGQLYNGQDGNALAAGTYFIGIRGGDATYTAFYGVNGGSADAGPITVRARAYDTYTNPSPDQIYNNIINVGNVGTTTAGVENVQTSTFNAAGAAVQWFRFSTTVSTVDNASYYLDIDTEGTAEGVVEAVGGLMDTEIGVYDSVGMMVANDDDGGNGFRSALSFGDNVNIRPAIAPVAPALAGLPRDGRSGALAAGNYWLAVGTFNVTFGGEWQATSTAAAATVGERKVNFRSNLPVPPSCTCCNLSNVAGPNQSTTPDDALTADDIIVFLGWYFANNTLADVAGPNQSTTPDGALTADDIIVFLGRYFAGC